MEILKLQAIELPTEVVDEPAVAAHTSSTVTVTTVVTIL